MRRKRKWVIYNREENTFWNNKDGYGHRDLADRYTEEEKFSYPSLTPEKPILDGEWMATDSPEFLNWDDSWYKEGGG